MAKRGVRLISGVSNNKPTARDYHERIKGMSVESLKRYIKKLESNGTTTQYLEDCYAYANAYLPIAIKNDAEKKKQKEIEVELKEQEKLKQIEAKNRKLAEIHARKQELLKLGNEAIRKSVLDKYELTNAERLSKMPKEKHSKKTESIKTAISNIDFARGQIRLKGYDDYIPVYLVYLTDKNVLLINGLYENAYLYYSPERDSQPGLLHMVSSFSKEKMLFSDYVACLKSAEGLLRKKLGEPTFYRFPLPFLKDMLEKYYLFYEERESQGTEKKNIPCFLEKKQ